MSNMEGFGSAGDGEIHAIPAEIDEDLEARIAAGREAAKAVYLSEAIVSLEKANAKLEGAKAEVTHAEEIVRNAEAEVARLEGGI